jgi:hypothetical protein
MRYRGAYGHHTTTTKLSKYAHCTVTIDWTATILRLGRWNGECRINDASKDVVGSDSNIIV